MSETNPDVLDEGAETMLDTRSEMDVMKDQIAELTKALQAMHLASSSASHPLPPPSVHSLASHGSLLEARAVEVEIVEATRLCEGDGTATPSPHMSKGVESGTIRSR